MNRRQRVWLGALVLGLVAGLLAGGASAEEKKAAGNATGTWKSSFTTPNGQTIETTYKLKQEGDKLTGTVTGRDGQETKIEDGTVKDGKVSFKVTRERNEQKFTLRFKGDLKGDSIKGKLEVGQGDDTRSFDWEAKRQK
jgi:hypothetical protein